MICDTQEQKNFLLECVRKYPTTYETALNLAQAFGQAIQDCRVVPIKEQLEKIPVTGMAAAPTPPAGTKEVVINAEDLKKVAGNGGDGKEVTENPAPDLTKGPAK